MKRERKKSLVTSSWQESKSGPISRFDASYGPVWTDVIELGVPFLDPTEGPVIQKAHERALQKNLVKLMLRLVRRFREINDTTPVVLMGYMDSVEHSVLRTSPRTLRMQELTNNPSRFKSSGVENSEDPPRFARNRARTLSLANDCENPNLSVKVPEALFTASL